MLPEADAACIVTRCEARPAEAIARGPTTLIADVAVSAAFNCETHRRLGGCRACEYQRKCNSENEAHIVPSGPPRVRRVLQKGTTPKIKRGH
jgi:ATP-dependent helicase YprA (DUF1998 family)